MQFDDANVHPDGENAGGRQTMSFYSDKCMSKSAFSLFAFSLYMFAIGLLLLVAPNVLLSIFGVPQTHEVWIRIVGILVLIIGSTDFMAARGELLIYLRWSVWTRLAAALCLAALVLMETAPPVLLLFAAIDGAAAIWTAACLRSEGSEFWRWDRATERELE